MVHYSQELTNALGVESEIWWANCVRVSIQYKMVRKQAFKQFVMRILLQLHRHTQFPFAIGKAVN